MPEKHTIAIAYKAEEWFLIDYQLIDLADIGQWMPNEVSYQKSKQAMLVYLQHRVSHQTIVLGNTHFEHSPLYDHVKFAQAVYFIERAAKYVRVNKSASEDDSLPFISGGDFNSLPMSSVLSAFYNENIESGDYVKANEMPSVW